MFGDLIGKYSIATWLESCGPPPPLLVVLGVIVALLISGLVYAVWKLMAKAIID